MSFSAHRAARSFPRIQQGLRTSAEGLGQRSRGGGAGVRGILPESSPGLGTRDARASVAAGPSPLTRTAAVRGSSAGSGQVALGFVFPADSAFLPPSRAGPHRFAHVRTGSAIAGNWRLHPESARGVPRGGPGTSKILQPHPGFWGCSRPRCGQGTPGGGEDI